MGLLIFDIPKHEVYIRSVILGSFIIFGIIISGLLARRKEVEKALRRSNRALTTLSECNQALVRASEESDLLHDICRIIVEIGGYRLAWVGFAEQDEAKTVRPVAQTGYEEGYLDTVEITWADTERGRGPTGTAIRTGKPCVVKDILTDPNYTPWRSEASKRGYESGIALPLNADPRVLGALNIYAAEPDTFDAEEVKLLIELADDLAYGIMALRTQAERKRAEEALRKSKARFGSIYDQSPIGIELYDSEGNLIHANLKCLELFGIRDIAAVQGFKLFEDPNISDEVKKRLLAGEAVRYESEFDFDKVRELELYKTSKTGKTFVQVFLSPWKTSSDDQEGFLVHVMDITERKQAEEELEKHREHLEELVKERTTELAENVAELERMNDLFVGREFRIKELRNRIKELELKIEDC